MEELEPETLVLILRFVHLHDTREMKGLTGMQIRDVVHMLDYLGCEKLFRDVVGAWEATIRKEASKSMKMAGNGLLYAALYLGLKECFVKMMNKLQNQANNPDCCVPPSKSTSATALRDKNMPLRFRNNKPMEFDPMLASTIWTSWIIESSERFPMGHRTRQQTKGPRTLRQALWQIPAE